MNRRIAALPLVIASSLAFAGDPDHAKHLAQAEIERAHAAADQARAMADEARAQADAARALSDEERAKLRAELDQSREQLAETSKRIAELSMKLNDFSPHSYAFQYLNAPKRALVGVVLGVDGDQVSIVGLTPNGPAAKAGILVGDRLVAIDGKAVPKGQGDAAVATARNLFGDLEDGQSVAIDVQREGKTLRFTPKAERRAPAEWNQLFGRPLELDLKRLGDLKELRILEGMPETLAPLGDLGERNVQVIIEREGDGPGAGIKRVEKLRINGHGNLNLSSLNPELGKYFGADRGILVLEADANTLPQLKSGDVIQVIDGQPADSVTDVMRLIARKPKGEFITIEIVRERQRQVLNVPAPEPRMFFFDDHPHGTPKARPMPAPAPTPNAPTPRAPTPIPPPKGLPL